MKNLIKTFDAFQKARPGFIMLECPKFIVNAFQSKSVTTTKKTWDITPGETAEPSVIKTYSYHPKYQEA